MARKPRVPKAQPQRFDKRLVLNRFMLEQLGAENFDALRAVLNAPENEDINETGADAGVSNFCLAISEFARRKRAPLRGGDRDSILQIYDQNIQKWTKELNAKRGSAPLRWKYFQYLALLFTEIYLDRFMNRREEFLRELNEYVKRFNAKLTADDLRDNKDTTPIVPYTEDDLRKLALWCATGSGKTLIMQMNIKQYLHYAQKTARPEALNRILLIVPNRGLALQHDAEFVQSGIAAQIFSKTASPLAGKRVEILEITKLAEKSGEETVAVEAFEDKNLVLVDEGHRGSKGEEWFKNRRALALKGFTFEYSATFGQAVSEDAKLAQDYAKSILLDYSYRYFYRDGFGKDYLIVNYAEKAEQDREDRALYLTACLLKFYQQKVLFKEGKAEAKKFQIENPLMIFVGGSVTKALPKKDASDIVDIVQFFAEFAAPANKAKVLRRLGKLLGHDGAVGLLDADGRDIFRGAYAELAMRSAEEVYDGILRAIFNAGSAGPLHIQEIKSADGEISLSLGASAKPFGVINVGDSAGLAKLLDGKESENIIRDAPNAFGGSLFAELNAAQSATNILIGSKKFTEGWNSYRVATMGLMNIGKSEGSQIIQLFGRGVRLKGYGNSLKRHRALAQAGIDGLRYNERLEQLETLNVFGINAEYMDKFKDYLEDEGVPAVAKKSIALPVIPNLSTDRLKIIALEDGPDFKRGGERPKLEKATELQMLPRISVDYYPRLQAQKSDNVRIAEMRPQKHSGHFSESHIAFLDSDALWFGLQAFKSEKGWFNLALPKAAIKEILPDKDWYEILIPEDRLAFDSFEKLPLWQDIAANLLARYCERFYLYKKNAWEAPHRLYRPLSRDNANFIKSYHIEAQEDAGGPAEQLERLAADLSVKKIPKANQNFEGGAALFFDRHLYLPLLVKADGAPFSAVPVPLNKGEADFVGDLQKFYGENADYFDGKELYLLRNMSRGKGVGFFEANNFYPDFIMWLLVGDKQYISFIDPKGLRNLGCDDAKIEFYREIKKIQSDLGNKNIILNSFIVSATARAEMKSLWGKGFSDKSFSDKNIIFKDEAGYIGRIFEILAAEEARKN